MKSVEIATVTTKGQIVIPARLRRCLGIKAGTRVCFLEEDNGKILFQPITRDFIKSLRGSLRGEPSPLKILMEERAKEREL